MIAKSGFHELLVKLASGLMMLVVTCCASGQEMRFLETEDQLKLFKGHQHIYSYQISTKSLAGQYPRANYFHPVNDFEGSALTEDFPEDHLHQRGVFWAWHQLILDGEKVADLWDCQDISWRIEEVSHHIEEGSARMSSQVAWLVDSSHQEVLHESVEVVYRPGNDYYSLDFEIQLKAAVDGLQLGGSEDEKGYGGFSARLLLTEETAFYNALGEVTPEATAVEAGNWMGMRGIGKHHTTVAILYHPQSGGKPAGMDFKKIRKHAKSCLARKRTGGTANR